MNYTTSLCQENLVRQEICNLLESEVTRPALERTFVLRTKSRSSADQRLNQKLGNWDAYAIIIRGGQLQESMLSNLPVPYD